MEEDGSLGERVGLGLWNLKIGEGEERQFGGIMRVFMVFGVCERKVKERG